MSCADNAKKYDFLLNIGFTLNEAKVYLALIQYNELNGYEASKLSGVSRSLVYDVLERLVNKGFVFKCNGYTNIYKALDYDKLIEKINRTNQNNLLIAKEKLKDCSGKEKESEFIFNIKGFDNFISKAKSLILEAKKEISLSLWKNEFNLIKDELTEAVKKGIKVYIFSFEDIYLENASIFSYKINDPEKLFPYRRTTIIVDNLDTLLGENTGDKSVSIYTKNHALTSLATDEIVLNIFWYKLIKKRNLLEKCFNFASFLDVLKALKEEFDIDEKMTKNFMVFDFQFGGNKSGTVKN